jgi:hypothetical protein
MIEPPASKVFPATSTAIAEVDDTVSSQSQVGQKRSRAKSRQNFATAKNKKSLVPPTFTQQELQRPSVQETVMPSLSAMAAEQKKKFKSAPSKKPAPPKISHLSKELVSESDDASDTEEDSDDEQPQTTPVVAKVKETNSHVKSVPVASTSKVTAKGDDDTSSDESSSESSSDSESTSDEEEDGDSHAEEEEDDFKAAVVTAVVPEYVRD